MISCVPHIGRLVLIFLLALSFNVFAGSTLVEIETPNSDGVNLSFDLDDAGNPVVSFIDLDDDALKILHCADALCDVQSRNISTPSAASTSRTSLVLDENYFPVVVFRPGSGSAQILHCNDRKCAVDFPGDTESIESPVTGFSPSVALNSSGNPVILTKKTGALELVRCDDPLCAPGGETVTNIPVNGNIDFENMVLDADDNPVIIFRDLQVLTVLRCDNPTCTGQVSVVTPDNGTSPGGLNALALDKNGFPVISYDDLSTDKLMLMRCQDKNCNVPPDISVLGPISIFGAFSSIAMDSRGNPVVAYDDVTGGGIVLIHCGDKTCSGIGDSRFVQPDSEMGGNSWLTLRLNDQGNPVMVYRASDAENLKILFCDTPTCYDSPPVAIAGGPYWGVTNTPIQLDGSGSYDLDSEINYYAWSISGAGSESCVFEGDFTTIEGAAVPQLTCAVAGEYELEFSVSSGTGQDRLWDFDTAAVTVVSPAQGVMDLLDQIDALQNNGAISLSAATKARWQLNSAKDLLQRGVNAAACWQLLFFVNSITFSRDWRSVDALTREALIAQANTLRQAIGCGGV
ncbi:hypothetical protein [uncultured Microbulbifer sp.]|uniref:hypothetical protein n=1 Tax=uncultured Microbulbifer sp. TaxID=348147 RepID=UPI00262AA392|nr:hypothetical protein [uncultured Microbulbifer sp.]